MNKIKLISVAVMFSAIQLSHAASYRPVSPQVNVPVTTVTKGGWKECYRDTYNTSGASLSTIQTQCSGENLMLACRPAGSDTLQLLAQAPRADVLFDTGVINNPHDANGTSWYYNGSWSWGFAKQGDVLNRNSCDTNTSGANNMRLCWHTGGENISSGYRCGNNSSLNGTSYERIIYQPSGAEITIFPQTGKVSQGTSFDADIFLTGSKNVLNGGVVTIQLNQVNISASCTTQQLVMKMDNSTSWGRVIRCPIVSSSFVNSSVNRLVVTHKTVDGVKSTNSVNWSIYPIQDLPISP